MRNNPLIRYIESTIKKTAQVSNSLPWRIVVFLPIIFSILMVLILGFLFSRLPPQVPLYYSRPWGEDQLSDPRFLFILPLGTMIGFLTTIIMIEHKINEYRVFSQILLLFQAGMSGIALLIIINIIRLVT